MILGGETERYRNSIISSLIINVSEEVLPRIVSYLDDNNVIWKQIKPLEYKQEEEYYA
jgi:D-methionine transport system ATP-binding protein